MSAKDTVIGTTKRLVAGIVGDGALAEEGSRQSSGEALVPRTSTEIRQSYRTLNLLRQQPRRLRTLQL